MFLTLNRIASGQNIIHNNASSSEKSTLCFEFFPRF